MSNPISLGTRQRLSWIKRCTRGLQLGFQNESRRACLELAVDLRFYLTRERRARNFQLLEGGQFHV